MCFGDAPEQQLADPAPKPEKSALPDDIGSQRKAEDEALFGGQPDLVRTPPTTGAITGGAGLSPLGDLSKPLKGPNGGNRG